MSVGLFDDCVTPRIYTPPRIAPSNPFLTPTQSHQPSRLFLNVKGDVRAAEPNEEAAHWLQVMKLYQQEYSKPFQVGPMIVCVYIVVIYTVCVHTCGVVERWGVCNQ